MEIWNSDIIAIVFSAKIEISTLWKRTMKWWSSFLKFLAGCAAPLILPRWFLYSFKRWELCRWELKGGQRSLLWISKRGINHVPVKKRGRGQKKRRTKEGRREGGGGRKVETRGVHACKIHRGRCWERKQPSRASHKYQYRTYLNVYAFLAPSLFLETSRRTSSSRPIPVSLSFSLFSLLSNTFSTAQCDLPELIRHCHANSTCRFESRGISLTRHAPRLHVRGELTRLVLYLVLSVSSPQRWLN